MRRLLQFLSDLLLIPAMWRRLVRQERSALPAASLPSYPDFELLLRKGGIEPSWMSIVEDTHGTVLMRAGRVDATHPLNSAKQSRAS